MSRQFRLTVLGLDESTVEPDDLRAAADAAYAELDERGVDLEGVASGVALLDDGEPLVCPNCKAAFEDTDAGREGFEAHACTAEEADQ